MTTNIDRARAIVEDLIDEPWAYKDGELASAVAGELHAENLLMPDLPEIDEAEGNEYANVYSTANGLVCLYAADNYGEDPMVLDPDDARDVALALLAAADYAERNTENDQ